MKSGSLFAALGVAAVLAFVPVADAGILGVSAQKKRGCPANYQNTCMASCMKAGGQARKCPAYCAKRQRENCAT